MVLAKSSESKQLMGLQEDTLMQVLSFLLAVGPLVWLSLVILPRTATGGSLLNGTADKWSAW